jgi:fluoride exporter
MQILLLGLIGVAVGSALGGALRYFVSGLIARTIGETFPLGTLVVNVSGSFAIGVLAAGADAGWLVPTPLIWQLAVTGFIGSYTTVSSFSLQTLTLAQDREFLRAGGNILLSLVLCLAATALGFSLAMHFTGPIQP